MGIGQRVEGRQLGAGRLEGLEVVGVDEAERRPGRHRHPDLGDRLGQGRRRHRPVGGRPGQGHHPFEVDAARHHRRQRFDGAANGVGLLDHRHQPEVSVAPRQGVVAS
ncbi:MAG TPA: hypothetical protein VFA11_06870 [Acidimicrobiales bacterium]|nr:hypothetical protein [Acidimicrobiales bacterium]